MTRDEIVAVVRQLLAAAHSRDLSAVMPLYADDAVAVSPVFGVLSGRAAIAPSWEIMFSTFLDLTVDVSDLLVEGNRVAILSSVVATDRVGWFGRPATGGAISYRLVWLLTVVDGRIVRDERIFDSTGVVERLEKARLDKELRTAADVQRTLLARRTHVALFCESAGDSVPCRAIGGDFFEFIDLPGGDVAVVMGDVAGKGPAAALLAAMLQGMFAVEAPLGGGPAATLSRMNQRVALRRLESRFATLVYGVLSADGRFVYTNAGHNPPALVEPGRIHRLTIGGPILGALAEATYEEEVLHLHDRDTLVMFTDGVTEARNARDEEFGDERLIEYLQRDRSSAPAILLEGIFAAVRDFCQGAEQNDDLTVTVTQFRNTGLA